MAATIGNPVCVCVCVWGGGGEGVGGRGNVPFQVMCKDEGDIARDVIT